MNMLEIFRKNNVFSLIIKWNLYIHAIAMKRCFQIQKQIIFRLPFALKYCYVYDSSLADYVSGSNVGAKVGTGLVTGFIGHSEL
jgi:hypothetical protein